jgi:hypothetical protein
MQKSAFSLERAFLDRESSALQNNKNNQQTLDEDKRWDWSNFLFAWGYCSNSAHCFEGWATNCKYTSRLPGVKIFFKHVYFCFF